MIGCFATGENATPIILLAQNEYSQWEAQQPASIKKWLGNSGFEAKNRDPILIPNSEGEIQSVLYVHDKHDLWEYGALPRNLPEGSYELQGEHSSAGNLALGWALESYRFDRFKSKQASKAKLVWPVDSFEAKLAGVIYWVRDLINRPANDLTPEALAQEARELAQVQGASINVIKGEDLVTQNFPAVYAVGKAGPTPHLIDLCWGDPDHPKVTLVGKGVCFDTGGLDLKHHHGMRFMKKDMGGGAHALGLGRLIMEQNLPIQLRVIVAALENGVAGNAMHPGDIFKTRKGLTIEVDNTDAEGRLILADCLTLAVEDKPELLIDFATLTGAARIALGTDLPALFTNDDNLCKELLKHANCNKDPLWQMPLWKDYHRFIESKVADLSNDASSIYGGAITAALFLENFVDNTSWAHIDMMAWNTTTQVGRPEGGEACSLRAVYSYLSERYSNG